jgi:hypothetical protein
MAPRASVIGRGACRSGAPSGIVCQDLEIWALVWSDRRKLWAMRAGHVERQRPRRTTGRHPAQASRGRASGGGFASGA